MIEKIFISGVSGFIGRRLALFMREQGYEVYGLSRTRAKIKDLQNAGILIYEWLSGGEEWADLIGEDSAFIHLAGNKIFTNRWSAEVKKRIYSSRILTGNYLVQLFRQKGRYPAIFMQASAIGYYGDVPQTPVDESTPKGSGFLSEVSEDWENSTRSLVDDGVKRYVLRIGVVLGNGGGALPQLILPYKFFMGASIGAGNQGVSWIHLDDVLGIVRHLCTYDGDRQIFNLSAPGAISNIEFCKILGKVLNRPCLFRVPGSILRAVMGEMASELVLNGVYVQPTALQATKYKFLHPDLELALKNLLKKE